MGEKTSLELLEQLGRGASGERWLARDQSGTLVCVKRLRTALNGPVMYERMHPIIERARRVDHPNIAKLHGMLRENGQTTIVSEYVPGRDLAELIRATRGPDRPMPNSIALRIAVDIARALAHAEERSDREDSPPHHGALSPRNIRIAAGGSVHLVDFGLASGLARASNREAAGPRPDSLWLGILLYVLVTRQEIPPPPLGTTKGVARDAALALEIQGQVAGRVDLGLDLERILHRLLSCQTAERYPDMKGLYRDLVRARERRPRISAQELWTWVEAACKGERLQPMTPPPKGEQLSTVFHFETNSGAEIRVSSYADLTALVASRSVGPGDEIVLPSGRRSLLKDLPWMREEIERLDLPTLTDPESTGALNDWTMLRRLLWVAAGRGSGRLRLDHAGLRKDLLLRRGTVAHVAGNLKDELLGPFLVTAGLVASTRLEEAFRKARKDDIPFGRALVAIGALSRERLQEVLVAQVRARTLEACRWSAGSWAWYPEDEAPSRGADVRLDPVPVVSAAVRDVPAPRRESYLRALGTHRLVAADHRPFGLERFALTDGEHEMVGLVLANPDTFDHLVIRFGVDEHEKSRLLNVLFLLHLSGHLTSSPSRP